MMKSFPPRESTGSEVASRSSGVGQESGVGSGRKFGGLLRA